MESKQFSVAIMLAVGAWLGAGAPPAQTAPCLIVTLTGTTGGPPVINGLAGAGTLVRYGDDADNCGAMNLQFDSGRDTAMRLSQAGVTPGQLNAIFFTHMHSDHTEGFAGIMLARWIVEPARPKIDVVCSSIAKGADVIVHSTIHPAMGPDKGSGFPAPVFYRQSLASDLGAMARRTGAKHLMLTHLIPPLGVARAGPFSIPGGPLTEADYRNAAVESGFAGNVVVGTDLASVRLAPR